MPPRPPRPPEASGCLRPPRLIIHDEDFLNNFGETIPGLGELAAHYKLNEQLQNKRPFAIASSVISRRKLPPNS